jgi:hypothetical protein
MRIANGAGWIVTSLGLILWLYGYFVVGFPPLYDWQSNAPAWIAEFLPNLEAEVGFLLMIAGSVPVCWVMYKQQA